MMIVGLKTIAILSLNINLMRSAQYGYSLAFNIWKGEIWKEYCSLDLVISIHIRSLQLSNKAEIGTWP
jgi:hypothetical protein